MLTYKKVPAPGDDPRDSLRARGCYPDGQRETTRPPIKELAVVAHRLDDEESVRMFSQEIFRLSFKPSFVTSLQGEWK